MRNMKRSCAAAMSPVKKEPVVIDLDSDDEDALCVGLNECTMDTDVSTESEEANPSNMQMIFSANDGVDDWDNKIDDQYMKLFDSIMDDGNSYMSDNPLRCIRYEVDNGGYDEREFKDKLKSREDLNTGRSASKKNVAVSKPPHRVQASKKKTKDFKLRRRESPENDNSVDAKVITTSHARRNSQQSVEAREKEIREVEMVPDERYKSYLTSLVEKWKSSRSNPEKEIQVKREEDDAMSLSDSDSIEVDDRPFLDEEDSPFVPSKSYKVVDLEEESDDECKSWFRKEIVNVLKQPYNEQEFKELEHEASVCRWLTKTTEPLDGNDFTYTTNQKKPSYLDQYPEFKRKFEKSLDGKDRHIALNLLRGFIFYLTKVARHDAFKPWLDRECLKITYKPALQLYETGTSSNSMEDR